MIPNYDINKEAEILKQYIRPVTEKDRETLPKVSHSRLEQMVNCPFAYNLKYNEKKYTSESSIALELGSLLHYVLEQKSYMLMENKSIDYDLLNKIMIDGVTETDEKTKEQLLGITALKKKYWEIWGSPDSEGRTYDQKLELFDKVLHNEMEDGKWFPWLSEHPFEFVFNDRVIIGGFIDTIRKDSNDNILCGDYKTSKKVFDSKKLPTSQQFSIYCMAILNEFGVLPIDCVYIFVLLNARQSALTKGWATRAVKKLNKILDDIDNGNKTGQWKPSASPLCYWCSYCETNPDSHEFQYECPYHSLWTPTDKNFKVAMEWSNDSNNSNTSKLDTVTQKRKIIF